MRIVKTGMLKWIVNDGYFGKIKDVHSDDNDYLRQFIVEIIFKHPNKNDLLKNFSDLYILVANISSHHHLREDELSWENIMNEEQYKILKKNKKMVIAYMLVSEKNDTVHYIEYIDTIIRKNRLAEVIIKKYPSRSASLIPKEIINSSAEYWAKILDVTCENGIVSKYWIDKYIEESEADPNDIKWNHLYDLCGQRL